MKYRLIILQEAFLDMEEAIEFYDTIQAKQKFTATLDAGLQLLGESPLKLEIKYRDVRIYKLNPYQHQIHYRILENHIEVIGVFYGRSNPETWEKRLTP